MCLCVCERVCVSNNNAMQQKAGLDNFSAQKHNLFFSLMLECPSGIPGLIRKLQKKFFLRTAKQTKKKCLRRKVDVGIIRNESFSK